MREKTGQMYPWRAEQLLAAARRYVDGYDASDGYRSSKPINMGLVNDIIPLSKERFVILGAGKDAWLKTKDGIEGVRFARLCDIRDKTVMLSGHRLIKIMKLSDGRCDLGSDKQAVLDEQKIVEHVANSNFLQFRQLELPQEKSSLPIACFDMPYYPGKNLAGLVKKEALYSEKSKRAIFLALKHCLYQLCDLGVNFKQCDFSHFIVWDESFKKPATERIKKDGLFELGDVKIFAVDFSQAVLNPEPFSSEGASLNHSLESYRDLLEHEFFSAVHVKHERRDEDHCEHASFRKMLPTSWHAIGALNFEIDVALKFSALFFNEPLDDVDQTGSDPNRDSCFNGDAEPSQEGDIPLTVFVS